MKNQIYAKKVILTPTKATLAIKFPCQISLQFKINEQLIQTKNIYKLVKGSCQFSEKLTIQINSEHKNNRTKHFEQQATIYLKAKLSSGEITAGSLNFSIQQQTEAKHYLVRLKNCLDPNGNIEFWYKVQHQRKFLETERGYQLQNGNSGKKKNHKAIFPRSQKLFSDVKVWQHGQIGIQDPQQQIKNYQKCKTKISEFSITSGFDKEFSEENIEQLSLKLRKERHKLQISEEQKKQISSKCLKLQRQIQKLLEKQKKMEKQNNVLFQKYEKRAQQTNQLYLSLKKFQNTIQCINRQKTQISKLLQSKQKSYENHIQELKRKYSTSEEERLYIINTSNEQINNLKRNQQQYCSKAMEIQGIYMKEHNQSMQSINKLSKQNRELSDKIIQMETLLYEQRHKCQVAVMQVKKRQKSLKAVNQHKQTQISISSQLSKNIQNYEQQGYQLSKKLHRIQIQNNLLNKKYQEALEQNKNLNTCCKQRQSHINLINSQYEKTMSNLLILKKQLVSKQQKISSITQLLAQNQIDIYEKEFILKVEQEKTQILQSQYKILLQQNQQIYMQIQQLILDLKEEKQINAFLSQTINKKDQQITVFYEDKYKLIEQIEKAKAQNSQNEIINKLQAQIIEQENDNFYLKRQVEQFKIQRRKMMAELQQVKEKNNEQQTVLKTQQYRFMEFKNQLQLLYQEFVWLLAEQMSDSPFSQQFEKFNQNLHAIIEKTQNFYSPTKTSSRFSNESSQNFGHIIYYEAK